jgi:DNA polymerase-3 subunit delta
MDSASSARHDILWRDMSAPDVQLTPVTLVVGPETLLAERAVGAVFTAARALDAEADLSEVSGSELTPAGLAEQMSPSLFATRRVLVVRAVQDVTDQAAVALLRHASAPAPDTHLVLVHPGGPKGKRLLDDLRALGAREVVCERVTRPDDQVAFVRGEVAAAGGRMSEPAARRLVEAVGADLRGLASAAAQLAADAEGGIVDDTVVSTYFEGRAEVKGWVVADRAVEGRTADALEQLRWALETGTDPVLVTAALATAVRLLARLAGAPRGVRDADIARDLGVPPWKVRILRGQLRGWTPAGLVRAIRAVAAADLAVKGAGNDPALALTTAVLEIGAARAA